MSITVKVTGTREVMAALEKIGDAFRDKLEAAVLSGCLIVQNEAKRKCAYITGNLRSSIHTGGYGGMSDLAKSETGTDIGGKAVKDTSVELHVGTNVEYARRVEYGFNQADRLGRVYHQRSQPYLRPALDENKKKVVAEICSALKEVLK